MKGKEKGVKILEPLGLEEDMDQEQIDRADAFGHVLYLYREQNWDEAEADLRKLLEDEPDSFLYQLYLDRIEVFRENPPEDDWDGVFTFKTK